jgi:uncharacterized membrane protein
MSVGQTRPVGHGHGLAHDHGASLQEVEAASVRRLLGVAVGLIGAAALAGLAVWWPGGSPEIDRDSLGFSDRVEATVIESATGPCAAADLDPSAESGTGPVVDPNTDATGGPEAGGGAAPECVVVSARLTSGARAGETATLETTTDVESPVSGLEAGDDIVLNDAGSSVPDQVRYSFADMQRSMPLAVLAIVFAVVVVALGRLRGVLALAGIVLSLGVLLVFIFPALLEGAAPIGVALTGATIIAFGTLYLAHGLNDRTTVALLGTMASLGLTAVLAVGFAAAAELSGLASEESLTLLTFAPDLDFRGLLLAAVIIGTLGVLDDVTITQVAAVWELHHSDPAMGRRQLYGAGIRIGRDHIASTVNTLVLAYAAAALPLLLIYTQSGLAFGEVLATETVAVEIVQTLVGSIGLVASVPLTTALACWVIVRSAAAEHAASLGRYEPWAAREPVAARPARPRRDPGEEFWTNDPW